MNTDPIIIAALISIGGVVLSSIIGSSAYLWKIRSENKRATRKVLSLLLEIRLVVDSSIVELDTLLPDLMSEVKKKIETRYNIDLGDDLKFPPEMSKMVSQFINALVLGAMPNLEEELLEEYEEALSQLSLSEPILAFQLRGKHRIQDILQTMHQYNAAVDSEVISVIPDEGFQQLMGSLANQERSRQFKDISLTMDQNCLVVARSCSWWQARKLQKYFEKEAVKQLDDSKLSQTLDSLLEGIDPFITNAIAADSESNKTF